MNNNNYICLIDFPKLGLEAGDYFPKERYTQEALDKAVKENKLEIEKEEDYFVTDKNNT